MLSRSLKSHASSAGSKPLQPNASAVNVPKATESSKRKFERTLSTTSGLGSLHKSAAQFNENDFPEDLIDIPSSPPEIVFGANLRQTPLDRSASEVSYPSLPQLSIQPVSSSAPVPWSSSPAEHHMRPQPPHEETDNRPTKRRTLPWLEKGGNDSTKATPLPPNKIVSQYPWNKTASAVKREQGELRKQNRARAQHTVPQSSKSNIKHVPAIMLSAEQQQILHAVVDEGKSIFFTGAAGTGKSVLMKQIIGRLRDKYRREPDRVAVTASTGLAAVNIEGITLHSFAGIGLGKEPAPELVKKIKRNASLRNRWARTKVLVIDEVSMVDADLFDKLEQIARTIRGNGRPYGGIQLVVTGDFFQLPPVPDRNSIAKFAFDAVTWNTSIEHTILLTHVFRQKDPAFAFMLNEMRLGKLAPATTSTFKRLSRPLDFKDELEATELFPTRLEVEAANNGRMRNLSGKEWQFPALDSGTLDHVARSKVLSNFLAPEVLTLKKGAQVMLIKNIDAQLVNGAIGKVQAFMNDHDFTVYKDHELDWHRSHKPDDVGDADDNVLNAKAKAQISAARYAGDASTGRHWPLVRFTLADNTCRELLCQPEEFKTEAPGGEVTAKRMQVPLILAWALSIHKAQGQTLERVKVNLAKVFEKGQAYVALSRATSQAGLQVLNFEPRKVMTHPRVATFYNGLRSIEAITAKDSKALPKDEDEFGDIDDEEALAMLG